MSNTRVILGISALYHDSAACLLVDGRLAAAAQEERFTRVKHDARVPTLAVEYCLREAGLRMDEVDLVGFYEKPLVKFERLLETYLAYAPRGLRSYLTAIPIWLNEKLWLGDVLTRTLGCRELRFGDHHESHAASAFYPSPFEEAAVLTLDGVGEWATSSIGHGRGNDLTLLKETRFPHSLGLLYSAFTYFTGFQVNEGEYKVMGLAPYGTPRYVSVLRDHVVDVRDDGSVQLNLEYFEFCHGLTMTGAALERLIGGPRRKPDDPVTARDMDLARSIQDVIEDAMLKMARFAHRETGSSRLCLAGGVALNCVGNGRILREGPFDDIWIQPAAGDAGGALGVAYALWHRYLGRPRVSAEARGAWASAGRTVAGRSSTTIPAYADDMQGALLGPSYSSDEIGAWLSDQGETATFIATPDLPARIAKLLADGKVVGLFQGRMEFGPRALGCRSIIADARSTSMQSTLNLKIKFRESFRPFAPAVLREAVGEWFALDTESPYMLLVAPVHPSRQLPVPPESEGLWGIDQLKVVRSEIPSVTHVDYSARVQTVRRDGNPLFYDIIRAFSDLTGCPVIVNTSFNVKDEPIVCTPADAYRCFQKTGMDALVLENYVLEKAAVSRELLAQSANRAETMGIPA